MDRSTNISDDELDGPLNAHFSWSVASKRSVSFTARMSLLQQAIASAPESPDFARELAVLHSEMGDHAAAWEIAKKLQDGLQIPDISGKAALAMGEPERAIPLLSLAIEQGHMSARYDLAEALDQAGYHEEASVLCEEILNQNPQSKLAQRIRGNALIREQDGATLVKFCDRYDDEHGHNMLLAAYRTAAGVILGDIDHKMLDAMHAEAVETMHVDLEALTHGKTTADLTNELETHPNAMSVAHRQATREGTRVSDLNAHPSPAISTLEDAIKAHVEAYLNQRFPEIGSEKRTGLPQELSLNMWAVLLDTGGYQEWHMHPDALVSGVYYVDVPEAPGDNENRAGWLEFGTGYNVYSDGDEWTFPVRPEPGLLVLFPSSFMHRTRPHRADERRISIAFDVALRS